MKKKKKNLNLIFKANFIKKRRKPAKLSTGLRDNFKLQIQLYF
jgi:hypothetical protein